MILIDEKPLFDETYDLLKARLFEDLSDSLRAQFQERGGFVHLKQLKELIVGSGDTVFRVDHRGAWAGAANFLNAPFSVDMNGLITCSNIVITGGTIDGVVITGLGAGSEIAIQGWQQDMAWSAIDHDTVAWAAGTITLLDGTTYNIAGGDTGTMSAITYIYLDIAVSTTVLRTTDTPATAIGSGKILIAVAQNVASGNSAIFQVFGGKALGGVGKLIIAPDIAANVITGNEIYGNTLAAIFADLGAIIAGNITLDASGFIKGGQTAFNTGIGFFLGYDTDAYKFSVGNPSGSHMFFEGTKLQATNITIVKLLTAGESFIGATSAQPVFIGDGTQTIIKEAGGSASYFSLNLTKKVALKYTPGENETVNIIRLRSQKDVQMTSNVIVSIQSDDGGEPSGDILGSAVISDDDIDSGSFTIKSSPVFSNNVVMTSGVDYWVVVEFETKTESDYLYVGLIGGGTDTGATYDGSTWTVDETAEVALGITCEYVSGQLFLSDANVTKRAKFHGFVTNTVSVGSALAQMMFSGFAILSGLTAGSTYYVSNVRGVISSSPGDTSVETGKAISTTQLLIKSY